MRVGWLIGVGVGVASACLALDACGKSSGTAPLPRADAGNGGAWTIGVSNSLTGGLSFAGMSLHEGWTVAEYLVNSNGGILGKPLKFIELDDQTDDNTQADDGGVVTKVAKTLIGDDVAAVIGPNGSNQVLTVQSLFFQNRFLEVTASATSDMLTMAQPSMLDGGRYLFRTVPPDSYQGRALAYLANLGPQGVTELLEAGAPLPNTCVDAGAASDGGGLDASAGAGAPGCRTLAIVYYDNAYGTPMEQVVASDYRGEIVASVSVSATVQSDYSTQIGTLLASKPSCLAMIVYNDVADALLLQMARVLGVEPGSFGFTVLGTDGVYDSEFIANGRTDPADTTSLSVAEGTYGTDPDSDPIGWPDYAFFASQYELLYPLAAGESGVAPYASNEFDAAMLIALAIAQAGGVSDRVKLRDAFYAVSNGTGESRGASELLAALSDIQAGRPVSYRGASGPTTMNPEGNVTAGYILWQVQNGNLVTLRHVPFCELPQ